MEKTLIPLTNAVLACVDNTDKSIVSVCCQPMFYSLMVHSKGCDENFFFLETNADVMRCLISRLDVSCDKVKMIPDIEAAHKCPVIEEGDVGAFINSFEGKYGGGIVGRRTLSVSMYGKADTILTFGTNDTCFSCVKWDVFKQGFDFVSVCDIGIGYTFVSNTFSLKKYLHSLGACYAS